MYTFLRCEAWAYLLIVSYTSLVCLYTGHPSFFCLNPVSVVRAVSLRKGLAIVSADEGESLNQQCAVAKANNEKDGSILPLVNTFSPNTLQFSAFLLLYVSNCVTSMIC